MLTCGCDGDSLHTEITILNGYLNEHSLEVKKSGTGEFCHYLDYEDESKLKFRK